MAKQNQIKPSIEGKELTLETKSDSTEFKRVFSKSRTIVSDVFKLQVAAVIKGLGLAKTPDENPADFHEFEHTHVFRTFDSDGKRHSNSASTAGHFHVIDWDYDDAGKPVVKSVSGPMIMGRKLKRGSWVQEPQPVNSYDDHIHEVDYLFSNQVEARTTSLEATKLITMEAQKTAPVAGVQVK